MHKKRGRIFLVSHVIDGETWSHDLGGISVYYISYITFERLDDGYTNECRIGMIFVTLCILKLDFYVTLCRAFHIINVANDIIQLGINMISWSWVVGDLTKTPDFSDRMQVNCLFFTREDLVS